MIRVRGLSTSLPICNIREIAMTYYCSLGVSTTMPMGLNR